MTFDRVEESARKIREAEAPVHYEQSKSGVWKFPATCPNVFSAALRADPVASWLALQVMENEAHGGRQRELGAAVTGAIEQWKLDYIQIADYPEIPELTTVLTPIAPNLKFLPHGSWHFTATLNLKKDFFSRDDSSWAMTENPIRRGRALREFTIAGSGWKGALRSAFRALNGKGTQEELLLFGSQKPVNEDVNEISEVTRGRLVFFSSYLSPDRSHNNTGLRVINPHSRETKAGTIPILYEVLKAGAICSFELLYVPRRADAMEASNVAEQEVSVSKDICEAVIGMFRDLGVGGKTSSGFGTFTLRSGEVRSAAGAPAQFNTVKKMRKAFIATMKDLYGA